jgi:hypothetical protein
MSCKVSYQTRLFKYLTPREFVSLIKTDRGSIKTSKFIPPRLGTLSLGKIYVEYNYEPKSRRTEKRQQITEA